MADRGFRIGGGVQDIPGGVAPRKHKLEKSNIEREEEEMSADRRRAAGGFIKFPMHVHKVGGMVREVTNDEQLAEALSKGWKEDIREVEALPEETPDRVNRMTVEQALAFIAEHANNPAKLIEIRADEESGGNRKAVLKALEAAEDNFGSAKAAQSAKSKK